MPPPHPPSWFTPLVLQLLQLGVCYLLLTRLVRAKWFRQCILLFCPVLLAVLRVGGVGHCTLYEVGHFLLLGLASSIVFRRDSLFSIPMCVFWGTLAAHLEWMHFQVVDDGGDFRVLALLTTWCAREFQLTGNPMAAMMLLPAAVNTVMAMLAAV
mgnify:CR=1 FL=1